MIYSGRIMQSLQRNLRVLVVDNDTEISRLLVNHLNHWGYEAYSAKGRREALVDDARIKAKEFRCHIVLMDLLLFDDQQKQADEGIDLAKELCPPARNIIISGAPDTNWRNNATTKTNADGFIKKGLDYDELNTVIQQSAHKCCAAYHGTTFDWQDELSAERIYATLIDDANPRYADQVEDVLIRLFPDAKNLKIKMLVSGSLPSTSDIRAHSIVLNIFEDDKNSVIVKLAKRQKIETEKVRYDKFINRRLGKDDYGYGHLEKMEVTWDIGAVLFSKISSEDSELFSTFFTSDLGKIKTVMNRFFRESWGKYYHKDNHKKINRPLYKIYCKVLGKKWIEVLKTFPFESCMQNSIFDWSSLNAPNPVEWFFSHTDRCMGVTDGVFDETIIEVTHGDLHGDNLFVDKGSFPRVIDFERTGLGHILQDFVELEGDIVNRLALQNANDWKAYYRLFIYAATPKQLRKRFTFRVDDPQLVKDTKKIISHLRTLAYELTGINDARSYVWGLLINTLFRVSLLAEKYRIISSRMIDDDPEGNLRVTIEREKILPNLQRALMFASILCNRLDNWDEPSWPPENWPVL